VEDFFEMFNIALGEGFFFGGEKLPCTLLLEILRL
jgi:hypothetical protein